MKLFKVTDESGNLIMIAPLKTISKFYLLHKDAESRILRETGEGKECRMAGRNIGAPIIISDNIVVQVIMGNDYPSGVWSDFNEAMAEVARLKANEEAIYPQSIGRRIYWRAFDFYLNAQTRLRERP